MAARAHLLIVDDEPNILSSLRRALELEGYSADVAGSGRIALEKLRARPFDLVLMDVVMRDGDGLSALKALRADQPELPVLMMSGNSTSRTVWPHDAPFARALSSRSPPIARSMAEMPRVASGRKRAI